MAVPFGISTMSFITLLVHLTVAVLSCFLWAVTMQNYSGRLVNLFEWLQAFDGTGKMDHALQRSNKSMSWLTSLAATRDWFAANYVPCLVVCSLSQALMILLLKKKCHIGACVSCFLWFILLLRSRRKPKHYSLLDIILAGVACVLSLYQLLARSVGDRIFGRVKKRQKRMVETKKCRSEDLKMDQKASDSAATKFKLPEELMFAEDQYGLDENIGSLSLGRQDCSRKHRKTTNSWFYRIGKQEIFSNERSSNELKPLIWPAKFHLKDRENGVSVRSRKKVNEFLKPQIQDTFQEYSDNESCSFAATDGGEQNEVEKVKNRAELCGRNSRSKLSNRRCNVLLVILLCSAGLNVCFVWLLRESIREALFNT